MKRIDFQLNNSAFTSGLREAVDAVEQSAQRMRQSLDGVGQNAKFAGELATQIDALKSKTSDWSNATRTLGTTFSNSLRGMLQGTTTFSKAWQSAITGMASHFQQNLAAMLLKWTEHHAMRSLVHAAANRADVASDAAADAQKREISFADTLRQVTHAAIKAAANAYNAVVGIPIVGPVLAPAAAAAAFTGVEAF